MSFELLTSQHNEKTFWKVKKLRPEERLMQEVCSKSWGRGRGNRGSRGCAVQLVLYKDTLGRVLLVRQSHLVAI